jgi:hypothetical protein
VNKTLTLLVAVAVFSSCRDTSLPDPKRAGTLSGHVVRAVPGWSRPLPAEGATVEILGSGLSATVDAEGNFLLDGIAKADGQLLIRFDADADGAPDAQRMLPLSPLRVGPGRDVSMGELLLGELARVSGQVRARADALDRTGHSGTTILVKGTRFITFSADDGSYLLDALPEGAMELVLFRDGYVPAVVPVTLSSGEERALDPIFLDTLTDARPAEVHGLVLDADGPLANARVQVVGVLESADVRTAADGTWSSGSLIPGRYNFGVEAEGHVSALLEGVVLVAGPQQLDDFVLSRGASSTVTVPVPSVAGGDAGVGCGGACAPGFLCSDRHRCESPACALASCAGACNDGQCFANDCSQTRCAPGEVCDQDRCVPLACAGVTCPAMKVCAAGRCVSTLCAGGPCPSGQVCDQGACVDARCVDVSCGAGRVCSGGQCLATNPTCAPGSVFVSGRCLDVRCDGVTCPAGSFCQGGTCTASGLFAAGLVYPDGRNNNAPQTVVLASGPNGWRRVNVTTLPRVVQLAISRDGQWLFAHTDDVVGAPFEGSVWRSADGVTWLQSWVGDGATTGVVTAIAVDHVNGRLFASLTGGPNGLSSSVVVSDDDGATWRTQWVSPLINGVIRERISGVSPDYAVINFSNFGGAGVYPLDGGQRFPFFSPSEALLLSDPRGVNETWVASDQLQSLDGGVLGPMRVACQACVLYPAASSSQLVHVASSASVWFSTSGQGAWGARTTPTLVSPSFRGLMRGVDGALFLANEGFAGPSLLTSTDDGVTWGSASDAWSIDPTLSDPIPAWQPDASYGFQARVRPTAPNGWFYECGGGGCDSDVVEPQWKTDGGVTPDKRGAWSLGGVVAGARLTALVSRACDVGHQRCGSSCVAVASDPNHCGACGVTCSNGPCVLGQCMGNDDAGTASGCADGTREGFLDETAWPDLAACAGTWPGELTANGADAICANGFHVCAPSDTELRRVGFLDAVAFAGCFAYRASNDGFDGCEPLECSGNAARDDMAGLGRSCRLMSGVQERGDGGPTSCLGDGTRIDARCCAASLDGVGCRQTSQTGVVCCRD